MKKCECGDRITPEGICAGRVMSPHVSHDCGCTKMLPDLATAASLLSCLEEAASRGHSEHCARIAQGPLDPDHCQLCLDLHTARILLPKYFPEEEAARG